MTACVSKISVQDIPRKTSCNHRGQVLVLSSRQDDEYLLCEILERSGFLCNTESNFTVCSNNVEPQHNLDDEYISTVLVLRKHEVEDKAVLKLVQWPGQRVIVLTDCTRESAIIALLEAGAHHVFGIHESDSLLQVRLQAALRKYSTLDNSSFSIGDIHFDIPKRRVSRAGQSIDLSPKEYDLAYYLFSNRDRTVGNDELMTSIWSLPSSMDTRRIDTAACRLRKKLKLSACHGWELKRLRRVGYQLIAMNGPDMPVVQPLPKPRSDQFHEPLQRATA